jgi:hypothetical protein
MRREHFGGEGVFGRSCVAEACMGRLKWVGYRCL